MTQMGIPPLLFPPEEAGPIERISDKGSLGFGDALALPSARCQVQIVKVQIPIALDKRG